VALYTDSLLVYDAGRVQKVTSSDSLEISGGFALSGTFRLGSFPTMPTAVAGGMVYDTTATRPKWSDGTDWLEFGGSLQSAYNLGNTITLSAGSDLDVNFPISGNAGILLDAKGVRSNFTVTNERLDLRSVGSRAGGLQVLLDCTNSSGDSQIVAQANTSVVVQSGASPTYPAYLQLDGGSVFSALEADSDTGAIYIGGTAFNSSINIGTSGARVITIGQSSTLSQVTIQAGNGINITSPDVPVTITGGGFDEGVLVQCLSDDGNVTLYAPDGSVGVIGESISIDGPGTSIRATGTLDLNVSSDSGDVNVLTSSSTSKNITLGSNLAPVVLNTFSALLSQTPTPVGYRLRSEGTSSFVKGDVVRYDNLFLKRSLASGAAAQREVVGIALDNDTETAVRVNTVAGTIVEVNFAAAPSGGVGIPVYLSPSSAGKATHVMPDTAGHRIYRLGTLAKSSPETGGGYLVVFQPQFVMDL
jgi:hypothetical protein